MRYSFFRKKKNKIVLFFSLASVFCLALVLFYFVPIAKSYPMNIGGRIYLTMTPMECSPKSNPNGCAAYCVLCGCGEWFQVAVQPYGGNGFYFCPLTMAKKGNNPNYAAGGYVLTGGSDPYSMDLNNTASVLGKNALENALFYAWFKVGGAISNVFGT